MLDFHDLNRATMEKIISVILGFTASLSALEIGNLTILSPQKGAIWASRAAINSQGAASVVWIKSHGQDLYSLHASTRANSDSAWAPAQTVSEPMKIFTFFPSVTLDGTSTIIWSGFNPQKELRYYYSQQDKSNPWTQAEAIYYPELSIFKDVITDYKGDPLVLASAGETTIHYFHSRSNEKSLKPFRDLPKLQSDGKEAFAPMLIKNPKGTIAALWGYYSTWYNNYYFKAALYQDSRTFNSGVDLGSLDFTKLDKDKTRDISASLNNKDEIAVIWSHFDSASTKHQLKTNINKETKSIRDSQDGFTDSAIWVDDEGNAVAVWIETFKKQNVVYAAFKPKTKSWQGVPQQLSNIDNHAEHVQLGFTNGVFVVVWGESDSTTFKRSIFGATLAPKPENFEWTSAQQLSPANFNCWYPSIAFGEKGGIITWTSHVKRSPDYQIQVADLKAP
jgi:hypothetical protein